MVNVTMVIFGGRNAKTIYNDLSIYSLESDEWTSEINAKGVHPRARYGHTAVVTSLSKMVVFGGRNSTTLFNDVAVLDLITNTWLNVTINGTAPAPRAYHTAVVDKYQHIMYIYGGANDGDTFEDVYGLDLDLYVWFNVPHKGVAATARSYHTAVLSPLGVMIVFGGVSSSSTARSDVACFDVVGLTWFACPVKTNPAPSELYGHTAVLSPLNEMVVFGGKNSAGSAVSDVWHLDTTTYVWDSVTPAGLSVDGRVYHTACGTALGSMLVFGGINSDGVVNDDFGLYNMVSTVVRSANDGAVLVVMVTLMGTIMIALCFGMDYLNEQSEIDKQEAVEKAKQEAALLLPKMPALIPKALHIPLGPRAQKFFDEFKTSLDPLQDPPK